MKTAEKIKEAVKTLSLSSSIDDLTVNKIVDFLGIKRQSFYYHYKDIYDVVSVIFLDDFYYLQTKETNKNSDKVFEDLNTYIKNNYVFLNIIANSNIKSVILNFIFDCLILANSFIDRKIDDIKKRILINGISSEYLYQIAHYKEYNDISFLNLKDIFMEMSK